MKQYASAIVWALFILFATIASTSTLEGLNLGKLFSYDKLIHMFLFGVLAFLLTRSALRNPKSTRHSIAFVCCLISACYGALTEVMQGLLTTTRIFDYYDMIANMAGCLVVLLFYLLKPVKH